MMGECWHENPDHRPSFSQLCKKLEDTLMIENSYLYLTNFDAAQLYYHVPSFNSAGSSDSKERIIKETEAEKSGRGHKKTVPKDHDTSTKKSGIRNVAFRKDSDVESVSTYL